MQSYHAGCPGPRFRRANTPSHASRTPAHISEKAACGFSEAVRTVFERKRFARPRQRLVADACMRVAQHDGRMDALRRRARLWRKVGDMERVDSARRRCAHPFRSARPRDGVRRIDPHRLCVRGHLRRHSERAVHARLPGIPSASLSHISMTLDSQRTVTAN